MSPLLKERELYSGFVPDTGRHLWELRPLRGSGSQTPLPHSLRAFSHSETFIFSFLSFFEKLLNQATITPNSMITPISIAHERYHPFSLIFHHFGWDQAELG